MNKKEIFAQWEAYRKMNEKEFRRVPKSTPFAILFGSDQVSIDKKNELIIINGESRIEMPGISTQGDFDWAVTKEESPGCFSIMFGCGDPFTGDDKDKLPVYKGLRMAAPYQFVQIAARMAK